MGDSLGLVGFDAYDGLGNIQGLHQNLGAYHDFFGVIQHQAVVAGQVGFAFHPVEQEIFGFGIFGRHQLYMGRETGSPHADNTHFFYLLDDFRAFQVDFAFDFRAPVNVFFPFVPFHIDEDGRFRIEGSVDDIGDFVDDPADRGVDHGA